MMYMVNWISGWLKIERRTEMTWHSSNEKKKTISKRMIIGWKMKNMHAINFSPVDLWVMGKFWLFSVKWLMRKMPQIILHVPANKHVTGLMIANTVQVTNKFKILCSRDAAYLMSHLCRNTHLYSLHRPRFPMQCNG